MKETFIKALSTLIGVDSSGEIQELKGRIESLEQILILKLSEMDKIQEIMSVLVMTNPHIKVKGLESQDPKSFISGSADPDRILN